MKKGAQVLVVHCVDTEGPIGGNVRRRPDGSAEFMDNWKDIGRSIRRITSKAFRQQLADSAGNPYVYNWFIMDFTGFKTNPKNRIAHYNDTYDHFRALPTKPDGLYWHYHHPPATGEGDQWSDSWNSSQEYMNILLHRLLEREEWPEAFRAGGTIEDEAASLWLEQHMMVDYSNRVSDQAKPTNNIFDFNWHSAPDQWGYYHPSHGNVLKQGTMRRLILRSVDLWSRLHVLTIDEVRQAFFQAQQTNKPVVLSYFSHDHREMYEETLYAGALIKQVSKETGIPWKTVQALPAAQTAAGIKPVFIKVKSRRKVNVLQFTLSKPSYQPEPWVGAQLKDKSLMWLPVKKKSATVFEVVVDMPVKKIVIAGTSLSGNKFVHVV